MTMLYKKGEHIIDVEKSSIHRQDGGGAIVFDFNNMCCYQSRNRSQPKPVRYCDKNNGLVYWASQKWNPWYPEMQESVNSLFNSVIESGLLIEEGN